MPRLEREAEMEAELETEVEMEQDIFLEPQSDPDPDILHLGCGDNYRPEAWNVDINPDVDPDEVVDLEVTPWPWPDDSFVKIRADHVFEHLPDLEAALRQCARVLRPGGQLVVRWPVGLNERADPDHDNRWVWDTPLYYCGERHWDVDVGLSVVQRSVTVHSHLSGLPKRVYEGLIHGYQRRYGPGRWQFDLPATSGEFTVVFQKP